MHCPPFAALALTLAPLSALAEVPAGQPIDDALVVDVTEDGFTRISDTLPTLVPDDLPVDDISRSGGGWAGRYSLDITGIDVDAEVVDTTITPRSGHLLVEGEAEVAMNSASDPARVLLRVDPPIFSEFTATDCDVHLRPVTVTLENRVYLNVVTDADGNRRLDATLSSVIWDWTLTGTDVRADNCWIGNINNVLEYVGISLFDLLTGPLRRAVDSEVQALVRDLETTLEDAFNSFRLDESFEFNDAALRVAVEPYDVRINESGLRLVSQGLAASDEADCIAANGITASASTDTAPPPLGVGPTGPHDIGLLGNDDFVNQVLFAAYRGGALCFTLSGDQGGLPINTSLLTLLAPGAFDDLFPEAQPMVIEVTPVQPPTAAAEGRNDVNVVARDLALDLYGELDGRQALIVGIDVDLEAGADLEFDGTTGTLDVATDLSSDNLTAEVRQNEFAPEANDAIPDRVGDLFDQLAGPVIGDALSGLSFDIPAFGTFGLQSLDASPAGDDETWFGFYATAGEVPYGSGGCSDSGGCADTGDEGCDQGCSATAGGRGLTLVALPLLIALLRRRR